MLANHYKSFARDVDGPRQLWVTADAEWNYGT